MPYADMITILALLCLMVSFFTGKKAVWITGIIGAVIAGGWAFDDLVRGVGVSWSTSRQILIVSILLGAAWEIVGLINNNLYRNP